MKLGLMVALVLSLSSSAFASSLFLTGTSGDLSASVLFQVQGTNLVVTLTNTSTKDVDDPTEVLTGVFFSGMAFDLTPISAVLAPGSTVVYPESSGGTDPGGVVGGEWAFKSGMWAPAYMGISSAGFGLFAPGDRFPGTNLQGPEEPDGLQYGITSAGDDPSTGNAPVTGSNALIRNSVIFTLSGLPESYELCQLCDVRFQYGTALSDPNIPGVPGDIPSQVPEPFTAILAGAGLVTMGSIYRRRNQR